MPLWQSIMLPAVSSRGALLLMVTIVALETVKRTVRRRRALEQRMMEANLASYDGSSLKPVHSKNKIVSREESSDKLRILACEQRIPAMMASTLKS